MKFNLNIIYCVLLFIHTRNYFITAADDFDYEHQSKWYDKYKECSKNRQSPIELSSSEAMITYDMSVITFVQYDTPYVTPAFIENNGHTANVLLPKPKTYIVAEWQEHDKLLPHIYGGPLPAGRYVVESLHFHWGSRDTHGSEHVIDGERYSMEMHILHRHSNYSNVEEARLHEDGLAVVAVLFSAKPNTTAFSGLDNIINALESIAEFNKTSKVNNLLLSDTLGDLERDEFYTYQGSLTTPPCSQAVTWIVFAHVISISHEQMERFHKLSDGHGVILENNYRSLQARGNRKVYLRRKRKVIDSIIESPMYWQLLDQITHRREENPRVQVTGNRGY